MRKKSVIIGIIALVFILLGIWLLIRPKALGNINQVFAEPVTSTSNISFLGEAGDKIKFSFRSEIENGDLEIVLYNSDGNVAYVLDKAKELETYFILQKADTYKLEAKCIDFVGNYKVVVYRVD